MNKKLKRVVLAIIAGSILSLTAMGQSHFVYIQSENSAPFYIKLDDSLMSSTQAGYLILPQLQKGVYPIIIGLAKKKLPEAAFKISIGKSGNKGFLLQSANGKLRLQDIQNKTLLKPAVVATSAGNRILPSTMEEIAQEAQEEEKEQESETSKPESEALASNTQGQQNMPPPPVEKPTQTKSNPFEKMLNAVTGGGEEPEIAQEEPETTEKEPEVAQKEPEMVKESERPKEVEEAPAIEPKEEKVAKDEEPILAFDSLLSKNEDLSSSGKGETTEEPVESVETEPSAASHAFDDLVFIDFDDEDSGAQNNMPENAESVDDTPFSNAGEIDQKEEEPEARKKRPGKRLSFDDLLAKIDTAVDAVKTSSVAKPFLSKRAEDRDTIAMKNFECQEVADQEYFDKVRRKMASKSSGQAMLRTATRYFSGDKCYTVSQIKQLAYLFATDDDRFQFLKEASRYCAEKGHQKELITTLSDETYRKRLRAYIK